MNAIADRVSLVNRVDPSVGTLRGRILYIVNDAAFFLSHRLPLAQAAKAAGMEVHVATPADDAARKIVVEGFAFHPIVLSRSGVNPWRELRSFLAIVMLLRSIRPDIVHTVTIKAVLYGGLAARLTRQRSVVSAIPGLGSVFIEQGWRSALRRRLVIWIYSHALRHPNSKVIFQNPEDQSAFVVASLVKPQDTVLIGGSGVDLLRFTPSPPRPGTPIVTFASRMLWPKGVREFVEAARQLRSYGVVGRFVLVGESDSGNPSCVPCAQLETWHRAGIIEWWGRREDMPKVFALTHIVCLPTYYAEGLPKVLIEAAACSRPIVTTDVPGCREVVRHEENGLLVPVRDVNALAAALQRLIEDGDLRVRMGASGRKIAEREFSIEKVVDETLTIYRELLS